ncbi:MAG: biotin--[acetyl-CoA-carboxylase] ligase [Subdoligranulum variabile]|nr:MAG: biotin--[acetyl-CoA-carboxylase] ligase [Subdoligranulum variabile]
MEAGAGILNESVICLPQAASTNAWAKEHLDRFGPIGAVYTTDQTAGRGRLGRAWAGAPGQALYCTVVLKTPLAQPGTLPLFASLAVADTLRQRYGVQCQIKWPNDLLLNGKKIVGILCESADDGHALLVGVGINLAQPQAFFDGQDLSHATSLACQGAAVDTGADPEWLAQYLTDFGFDRALYTYEVEGFAPYRERYKAACVNLGRTVTFDGGSGVAEDIDEEGRLVVRCPDGVRQVFTGEVSVRGIYGAV